MPVVTFQSFISSLGPGRRAGGERGELFDVVAATQRGDILGVRVAVAAAQQQHELVQVVLMAAGNRRLEEQLGRFVGRVGEGMRGSLRNEHEGAWSTMHELLAFTGLPLMPVR